jgi:uncharacterized protein YjbI with pentapeptide repeats
MANPEHLQILQQGVEAWNAWREQNRNIRPDLSGADLAGADLTGAVLHRADLIEADLTDTNLRGATITDADLTGAILRGATLTHADLSGSDLRGATLTHVILREAGLFDADLLGADLRDATLILASLREADLRGACLTDADLSGADLTNADLSRATLRGANFSEAFLYETVFIDTSLTAVRGLETCHHRGPSTLDHRTLAKSGPLPQAFLRGCGLPDALINYLPSLLNEPFQFYSCFISHASQDRAFAERLHADLQNKGVRCWFAPEDMKIGDHIRPRIDETIRL